MYSIALAACLVLGMGEGGGAVVPVSPYARELRFSGRVDRSDPQGPRFAWSGTRFKVRFTGTMVRVRLRDLPKVPDPRGRTWPNRFQVTLDEQPPSQVLVRAGAEILFEQAGLLDATHQLEVYKQTEAMVGESQLLGIELSPGGRLLPPRFPPPSRHIAFFGDSVTTGYGDEGTGSNCHYSAHTQNHLLTYGELTAQALGAEAMDISWSGRGVVRNNPDAPAGAPVLPQLADLTLPAHPDSPWDDSSWKPDVVVVNLGANDFASGDPGEAVFKAGYEGFLVHLRARYPEAFLVACIGPTLNDQWPPGVQRRTKARRFVFASVLDLKRHGDHRVDFLEFPETVASDGYGCDFHPSLATHRAMSTLLVARLRSLLGW